MKKISLLMIDNIFLANPEILSDTIIKEYLGLKEIKPQELSTINKLCEELKKSFFHHHFFENYYLNYQIPQIGKEFDLLRIGEEIIINIELKSENLDDSKILKQLKRNYYYLSFLKKHIYCFTFVTDIDCNRLYFYNHESDKIQEISIDYLIDVLKNIKDINEIDIDNLFNPTNYLISPFNTTERFVNNEYFLTKQQEEIRTKIIKTINNNQDKIFSISGSAGTGKTLLTYDIVKELKSIGKNVCIIHCAQTNSGIEKLQDIYGWNILPIKSYSISNIESYDILIVDESQRISMRQLEEILNNQEKFLIFSHDVNQRLNKNSRSEDVVAKIEGVSCQNKFSLSNKIRHNKNFASFIKKFFDLNKIRSDNLLKDDYRNISFYFTQDINDAEQYIGYLKAQTWEHIYLTNSLYNREPLDAIVFSSRNSSHQVIGQEFNNVVVTIDKNFYYTEDKKLSYRLNTYHNPLETLFQAITRTRKKLIFVIIDNEKVYRNCIKIINRDE